MPGRICALVNCSSSTYHLSNWKSKWCSLHECNNGTSRCVNEPPFTLHPFTTVIRDPEGRRNWIRIVNRFGSCSQKHWQPNHNHGVCSKHFVETPTKKRKPGNLDCTEVLIEGPRYLALQAHTCSDYKKHNTLKFLVAFAPMAR